MTGAVLSAVTILSLGLAACGSSSSTAASGPKGCKHIGFLLPESDSSARWESKDHPLVLQEVQKAIPGATVDIENANGSDDTQLSQANAMLTNGVCILIVAPHDSAKASAIVQAAKKDNVPVIAYDRLIKDPDLNYYVSFDNVSVGKAQGAYIVAHYQSYVTANGNNNLALIDGSSDDNNALLFHQGAIGQLQPLIDAKSLTKVYDQNTPGWNNATAQTEMDGVLTTTGNKLAIAYVANDGMAGTVIASLAKQGLAGKVLVTGQDATVDGIHNILIGNQAMTVYKPIVEEAQGAAAIAAALSNGTDTSTVATSTVANGSANTPSVLKDVVSVDKLNVATTVVKDGFVTVADICKGIAAGTDTGGVCP